QSWPTACTATTGADFSPEKSLPCRFCGRNPQDYSKIWRGWPWAGELAFQSSRLQKVFLDKLRRRFLPAALKNPDKKQPSSQGNCPELEAKVVFMEVE
ncbi:MAG: hypothetical protein PUD50_12150, partial [Eubacteriales bacterium]|nr:hypothetical protein [Eubacteriales bacterium]